MERAITGMKSIGRLAGSWLVLFAFVCSAFGSVLALDRGSAERAGMVFCPLQKRWVKEGGAGKTAAAVPLADICAPRRGKTLFVTSLVASISSQISVDKSSDLTELYFAFQAKGSRVFAAFPTAPDGPKAPTTVSDKSSVATGAGRSSFVAVLAQYLSLQQLSRPPTPASVAQFYLPQATDLQTVVYAITPRGPPLS